MADEEGQKRMEAALAIIGMANSAPVDDTAQASPSSSSHAQLEPQQPGSDRRTVTSARTQQDVAATVVEFGSNGQHPGTSGTSQQHARQTVTQSTPMSDVSQKHAGAGGVVTSGINKHVVLPKIPRHALLRSHLEWKMSGGQTSHQQQTHSERHASSLPSSCTQSPLSIPTPAVPSTGPTPKRRRGAAKAKPDTRHNMTNSVSSKQERSRDLLLQPSSAQFAQNADSSRDINSAIYAQQRTLTAPEAGQTVSGDESGRARSIAARSGEFHRPATDDTVQPPHTAAVHLRSERAVAQLEVSQALLSAAARSAAAAAAAMPPLDTNTTAAAAAAAAVYGNLLSATQAKPSLQPVSQLLSQQRRPVKVTSSVASVASTRSRDARVTRPSLSLKIEPPATLTASHGAYLARPGVTPTLPGTTPTLPGTATLPRVVYSPISPPTSAPARRTSVQSEPLDLSTDPRTATVPLMQLVSPGVTDVSSLGLFNGATQAVAGTGGRLPFQYVNVQQDLAVADGKLVVVASPGGVSAERGAVVSDAGALLANPEAFGMQLVEDRASGYALLVPSPQVRADTVENPFIPRNTSSSSSSVQTPTVSSSRTRVLNNVPMITVSSANVTGSAHSTPLGSPAPDRKQGADEQQTSDPPTADTTVKAVSPRSARAQSSLPPKKRRYQEDTVTPPSVASSADEGYHTLKEDVPVDVQSPTVPEGSPRSSVTSPGDVSVAAYVPQSLVQRFSQLAPTPRMSTGLVESRTAQALLLPRAAPDRRMMSPPVAVQQVAQSLPVNIDVGKSSPLIPTVASSAVIEYGNERLMEEYQRAVLETREKASSKSPFQHFRPARGRHSKSTRVNVDLTSGNDWTSAVTEKMQMTTVTREKSSGSDVNSSSVQITTSAANGGAATVTSSSRSVERADPELVESCRKAGIVDADGDLPLHLAVLHSNPGAVDKLLYMMQVADVDVDHLNNDRQTALHLSLITKNESIVLSLLRAGSNPNIADRKGHTGVHLAVKHASKPCLLAILQRSLIQPDLNAKNYDGFTALHLAVLQQKADFVQLLLLAKANVDIQDNRSGRTALFHACEMRQFPVASALLSKGASVNIASYAGTTAAQAANGRGYSDIVALLIKYGAEVSSTVRDSDSRPSPSFMSGSSGMRRVRAGAQSTRQLRRPGSVNDLTRLRAPPHSPAHSSSQAHSLDPALRLTLSTRQPASGGGRTSKRPGIILPPQDAVAASMPLSPSALGLATTKRLPMIPPMHANSLPDDVRRPTSNKRLASSIEDTPSLAGDLMTPAVPSATPATRVTSIGSPQTPSNHIEENSDAPAGGAPVNTPSRVDVDESVQQATDSAQDNTSQVIIVTQSGDAGNDALRRQVRDVAPMSTDASAGTALPNDDQRSDSISEANTSGDIPAVTRNGNNASSTTAEKTDAVEVSNLAADDSSVVRSPVETGAHAVSRTTISSLTSSSSSKPRSDTVESDSSVELSQTFLDSLERDKSVAEDEESVAEDEESELVIDMQPQEDKAVVGTTQPQDGEAVVETSQSQERETVVETTQPQDGEAVVVTSQSQVDDAAVVTSSSQAGDITVVTSVSSIDNAPVVGADPSLSRDNGVRLQTIDAQNIHPTRTGCEQSNRNSSNVPKQIKDEQQSVGLKSEVSKSGADDEGKFLEVSKPGTDSEDKNLEVLKPCVGDEDKNLVIKQEQELTTTPTQVGDVVSSKRSLLPAIKDETSVSSEQRSDETEVVSKRRKLDESASLSSEQKSDETDVVSKRRKLDESVVS